MKIYLIIESSGMYDDYRTEVIKAFKNKSDADRFIERYNKELKIKLKQEEKCQKCEFYWECSNVEEKDYLNFIKRAKIFCPKADFSVSEDNNLRCNCENYTLYSDTYHVQIKEISWNN